MNTITYFKNLPSTPFASGEDIVDALDQIQTAKAALAEAHKLMTQVAIEWIHDHGDITIGENRWYKYTEKKYHEISRVGTMATLLNRLPALEDVADRMCAQPWKHGALKKDLGDDFPTYFTTEYTDRIKLGKDDGHARG